MRNKTKYRQVSDSITVTLGVVLIAAVTMLLPSKIAAQTETMLNETVIQLIETDTSSVETEKTLTEGQESIEVYKDIPAIETTPETQENAVTECEAIESVCKESLQVENETAESKTIEIDSFNPEWHYYITEEEARLIALVAESEDRDAMPEIAEVILNRALSPKFPDNVEGVIYQPKQFHTAGLITDDMMPSDEAVAAVMAVYRDGESTVGEAVFFAEKSIDKSKIAKNLYLTKMEGGTAFYGQR